MKKRIATICLGLLILLSLWTLPALAQEPPVPPELDEPEEPVYLLFANGEPVLPNEDGVYVLTNYSGTDKIASSNAEVSINGSIELRGKWKLISDIAVDGAITVFSGSFKTMGHSVSADAIFLGEYATTVPIDVNLGASTINVDIFATRGAEVALDSDHSSITTTLLFDSANKSGRGYYGVRIKNKDSIYGYIEGASNFDTLTIDSDYPVYIKHNAATRELAILRGELKAAKDSKELTKQVTITRADKSPVIITN